MQIPPGRRGSHTPAPPHPAAAGPPAPMCACPPPCALRPSWVQGQASRARTGLLTRATPRSPGAPAGSPVQSSSSSEFPNRLAEPPSPGNPAVAGGFLGSRGSLGCLLLCPRVGESRCAVRGPAPPQALPPAARGRPESVPAESRLAPRGALMPSQRKSGFIFLNVKKPFHCTIESAGAWRGNEAMGWVLFFLSAFLCTKRSNFRISSAAPSPGVGSKTLGSFYLSFKAGAGGWRKRKLPSLVNSEPSANNDKAGTGPLGVTRCGVADEQWLTKSCPPTHVPSSPTFRSVPRVLGCFFLVLLS